MLICCYKYDRVSEIKKSIKYFISLMITETIMKKFKVSFMKNPENIKSFQCKPQKYVIVNIQELFLSLFLYKMFTKC